MRPHDLALCALITLSFAIPAAALECSNAGAAPVAVPDDTGDGNATACGSSAVADGSSSIALGYSASSAGVESTALGYFASAGDFSAGLGWGATSSGVSSAAVGFAANSAGHFSTALGYGASSSGEKSTALGAHAVANQPDTVIIGSIAGVNNAIAYAKVGIGTSAPSEAVDVQRSAAAARFQLTSLTDTANEAPQFIQRRVRGTNEAPVAVQNNDNLGLFSFRGYNGVSIGGSRATITAQAAGNFTGASTPTRLIFATTPVGQTVPQQVLVITPDGKLQVNGVNLSVPDYVFEDHYELMPLDELKSFIDENGHLPGIAPAHEVNSEGLDLAGSQMDLLEKVEELTLYTLQQEGRLTEQASQLEAQREHLAAQQKRIDQLESMLTAALTRID